MRSKAKKLLITTEKHEIFIVRVGCREGINGFCPACDREVEMLTVDSVVSTLGISGREVIRRITSDEIHSIETTGGHLLVCRNSLKN